MPYIVVKECSGNKVVTSCVDLLREGRRGPGITHNGSPESGHCFYCACVKTSLDVCLPRRGLLLKHANLNLSITAFLVSQ